MLNRSSKIAILAFSVFFFLVAFAIFVWAMRLNKTITDRLAGKRWAAPTEFYAAPERFVKGQAEISKTLSQTLERLEYQAALPGRIPQPGEFADWNQEFCRSKIPSLPSDAAKCWAVKPHFTENTERPLQVITVSGDEIALEVYEGDPPQPVSVTQLEPELFAQFYGGQPVLRQIVSIGDVPPRLLNAILAIEDSQFLIHHGVSFTGILRAALRNMLHGRVNEGGSTITQQLIKNYFLTSERTFRRKLTEILMALILESKFSKNDILETYINEVYLGQEGPFEIHGVGVAAKSMFNKRADDLTLAECALLAGTVRGPNYYSPFKYPERAKARRAQVLKRMLELNLIDAGEYETALQEPLPKPQTRLLKDLAPFFVDSVKIALKKLGFTEVDGLSVFTTLNMRAQQAATEAVANGVTALEKQYDFIQKTEKKNKIKLEAALISADPTNGFVEAVVGGRSYGETQLNRVLQSRRQVGSVFKPFVYLTAMSANDETGHPYTPLTHVLDEKFTVKYEGQTWSPDNYNNKYEGNVPLFKALEGSLNAATSKIALQVGIKNVVQTAQKLGIESPLTPVPSLALGSSDLTPFEVLQAYATLARRGELNQLTFVYKVENPSHQVLYQFSPKPTQVIDAVQTRETTAMMEGVVDRGTGKAVRALGFAHPAAGKTGTTSDTKDAWFAGFTPLHVAVVWVGYDQPETTGLTGGLGAVPIWTSYMKAYASHFPPVPFQNPEGSTQVTIDSESEMLAKESCPNKATLVFKSGTEPATQCWQH